MSDKVVVVSVNPSLDKVIVVDKMRLGKVNSIETSYLQAGGKGLNVVSMLKILGINSQFTGFVGGRTGRLMIDALKELQLKHRFVMIDNETRTNIKVICRQSKAGNAVTEFNDPGPLVNEMQLEKLKSVVKDFAKEASYLVAAGSMPPGCPADFYCDLIRLARSVNSRIKIVVDTSGEALVQTVKSIPSVIKPNLMELEQLSGKQLTNVNQVRDVCLDLHNQGIGLVVCTLGAEGAVAVASKGCYLIDVPVVKVRNTVGCGDAFVAGLIYSLVSEEAGLKAALTTAATAGAVAACQEDVGFTNLDRWEDIYRQIRITSLSQ